MSETRTVKAVLLEMGCQVVTESVIQHIKQYWTLDVVYEGIVKSKLRDIIFRVSETSQEEAKNLVLLKCFGTDEDGYGYFEYIDRYVLYYRDTLLKFQFIPEWDLIMRDRFNLLDFDGLDDETIIEHSKYIKSPQNLLWDWENWWSLIIHVELAGKALEDKVESVIELTARYLEFLLGNRKRNSEMKTYSFMDENESPDDLMEGLSTGEKQDLLRDYLLNRLSEYTECRSVFQQLQQKRNID